MRLNLTAVVIAVAAIFVVMTAGLIVLDLTDPNTRTEDTVGHLMVMWGAVVPGLIALLALRSTNGKVAKLNGTMDKLGTDMHEATTALHESIRDRHALHDELERAREREIELEGEIKRLKAHHRVE